MMASVTIFTAVGRIEYVSDGKGISVTSGELSGPWASVVPSLMKGKTGIDLGLLQGSGTAAMNMLRSGWAEVSAIKSLMWSAATRLPNFIATCTKRGELETSGAPDPAKVAAYRAQVEAAAVHSKAMAEVLCEVQCDGRTARCLVTWLDGKPFLFVDDGAMLTPFADWNGLAPMPEKDDPKPVDATVPTVRRGRPRKDTGTDLPPMDTEAFAAWCRARGGWAAAARYINSKIEGARYRDTQVWSWANPGKTSKARAVPAVVRAAILSD